MKRKLLTVLSVLLTAALLAGMLPCACITAEAETSGDYVYEVLDDGTVSITGYNGDAEEVAIPSEIDGKKVTALGEGAFSYCTSLKSVTIPDSVTAIGNNAFYGCTSLTSLTIPHSVTEIWSSAFWGCTQLTSIIIPDSVTEIGEGAFEYCDSLTIYGNKGSYAEQYANENDIPFKTLEELPEGDTESDVTPDTDMGTDTKTNLRFLYVIPLRAYSYQTV